MPLVEHGHCFAITLKCVAVSILEPEDWLIHLEDLGGEGWKSQYKAPSHESDKLLYNSEWSFQTSKYRGSIRSAIMRRVKVMVERNSEEYRFFIVNVLRDVYAGH